MTSRFSSPTATPRAARLRSARWVILAACLLVTMPVLVKEIPRERARWHFAAAVVHEERREHDRALRQLAIAARLDPAHIDYPLAQARMHTKLAKITYVARQDKVLANTDHLKQAFHFFNRAENIATEPRRLIRVCRQRAELHLKVHDWERAARDMQTARQWALDEFTGLELSQMLNHSAYVYALAGFELDTALADINKALDLLPETAGASMTRASYLDTRGYVYYRRGEYTAALADLNQAIELYTPVHLIQSQQLAVERKNRVDVSGLQQEQAENKRTLAVLLYHRLLVHTVFSIEKPESLQAMLADERRIRELGFQPNESLY